MLALILSTLALASDPPIVILSPKERQVVQRVDDGPTPVPVQVMAPSGIGRLVASVRPSAGGADLASAELVKTKPGAADSTSGFTATLHLPAGGWYRLAISVDGIAGPVELARVERFGVGEVFVVAGQSNSANSGEEKFGSLDERVSAFDGHVFRSAADPMPGVQDSSKGGSPWPVCGQALVAAWDVPVAFASCGYGGTSIADWQKGAPAKDRAQVNLQAGLVQRLTALGRVRAILWHQGESDAHGGTSAADYVARFTALRDAVREQSGVDAPWVVARVSFVPGCEPAKMEAIRDAQARLWREKLALEGPDTDDLLGDMRHSQDKIHFSKAGLEAHARRWSDRLVRLFPKR